MRENPVFYTYRSPFGKITIAADGQNVLRVVLGESGLDGEFAPNSLTNECANQLMEYFAGKRSVFTVPFLMEGTDFQKAVWSAVCDIPYSHVKTNEDIAEAIGHPGSYRMVGAAVRQNPLVILVPAHRIIPANGRYDANDESARLRAAFRDLEARYK